MKHTLKSVSALAATLITFGSLAGGANGAIITFNGNQPDGNTFTTLTTYVENGFTLTNTAGVNLLVDNDFSGAGISSIDDDALANDGSTSIFTMTFGGGAFNLLSLEHIGAFGESGTYSVIGTLVGGESVSDSFSFFAGILNTHTFTNFNNLTSAEFASDSGGVSSVLDNINVVAVPEPSSALLLGLVALGLVGRRRRD